MPYSLDISSGSYHFLSQLQYNILHSDAEKVILNFTNTSYVNAIFMAYLGGLPPLCKIKNISLVYRLNKRTRLYTYFKHSGLYEYLLNPGTTYVNENAIPFAKISMDEDSIIDYINKILDLAPIRLTSDAEEYVFKNIYEIFANSSEHSGERTGVYACGHWMPQKNHLVFSVYDTGIGIPTLIQKKINSKLNSMDALAWALKTGHSTNQLKDGIPRGLGLSDLLEFIGLNEGELHILSNDVYYSYTNGTEKFIQLKHKSVGTMIGFKIVSDYDHIYKT
jgi:hypothetical protein